MTIRELINILIDADDKDKPVEVEYRQTEVEQNNNGYEWNQLKTTGAVISGRACIIEVHPFEKGGEQK